MSNITNNSDKTGERIRQLRKSSGLSQADLADKLNVGRDTIGKLERGRGFLDVRDLRKMADIFDCDTGYLLCDFDTLRIGSASHSDYYGVSTAALDNLRSAALSGNPYVEIVSQLLQDESLLNLSAAVVAADYGRISQTFDALDPFTGKHHGRIISPEDLHDLDRQHLFSALCDFLDNFRKMKEGSSNLETD